MILPERSETQNSGPWHDCILVKYETVGIEIYPLQVHSFFYGTGRQNGKKFAVGKMGQENKRSSSQLLEQWTYEKQYRIVDLETTSEKAFALTIPASCYKQGANQVPHRMFVIKDRINEWPSVFNDCDWTVDNTGVEKHNRKRKTR